MNELQIFEQDGTLLVDSRDVAQMVDRNHKELLKTIRIYCGYLRESEIAPSEFFIPSTYQSEQNHTTPNYLLTKKGCDMVANKMTGPKGVLFTAAYVQRFDEMEKQLKGETRALSPAEQLVAQAQLMVSMEKKLSEVTERVETAEAMLLEVGTKAEQAAATVQNAIMVYSRPDKDHWVQDMAVSIRELSGRGGWSDARLRGKLYEELEQSANVNIASRLTRLQERKRQTGATYKESRALTKLDAIAASKELRLIFEGIVKKHQAESIAQ